MIQKYSTISIIYGGSGKKYAETLRDRILYEAKTNRYPVSANIILDCILVGSITTSLVDLFKKSNVCVAFLTADDTDADGRKRIRQNVLFELGMAIMYLGEGNCIILQDFDDTVLIDWPTDIAGLTKKTFSPDNLEEEITNIIDKALRLCNGTEQYDYLLTRKNYRIDYKTVFDGYAFAHQLEGKMLLEAVLKQWTLDCKSLKYFDERCLFILERVGFLPVFGSTKQIGVFLENTQSYVNSYDAADLDEYKVPLLEYVKAVMSGVLKYSELKEFGMDTPDNLESLLADFRSAVRPKRGGVNPLIDIAFYDYYGLTALRLFRRSGDKSNLDIAYVNFKKALRCSSAIDSLGIWRGFILYNLARVYENLENYEEACTAYKEAVRARKNWINCIYYKNTIRSALSYEYFLAKITYLEMCQKQGLLGEEEIHKEYLSMEREFTQLSEKDDAVGRLLEIRKKLLLRLHN